MCSWCPSIAAAVWVKHSCARPSNGPYQDMGWLLHTADANGLNEKFGFERCTSYLMERLNPPS
jgi:hypothetical protein